MNFLKNDIRPKRAVTNEIEHKSCDVKDNISFKKDIFTKDVSKINSCKTEKNFNKKKVQRRKKAEEKLLSKGVDLVEVRIISNIFKIFFRIT